MTPVPTGDKIRQLLIHIAGCVTFLALPIVFSPDASNLYDLLRFPPAMREFIVYVLLLLFFYFNFFWLIPTFYFRRKYISFFALAIVCFGLIVLLPNALIAGDNVFHHRPGPPHFRMPPEPRKHFILVDMGHQIFLFLAVFFFSLILKIRNRWKQAEQEKLNAELSYLKAQINPHFLFNVLNSIYSLAVVKSDETPTAVIKLSGMMRYVLNDASHHMVPLSREVDYIRDYIELQRIRFGASLPLTYTVNGTPSGQLIAPLILISFVENAFKYGINAAEDAEIKIDIRIDEQTLQFQVFNKKVSFNDIPAGSSGLGIENTKKRLELLYSGRHTLDITDAADHFSVSLLLQLI
ncbi:sensor histidine kinase [Chitinophaga silvisoli]|uniref:Sensor histidine kinase n=1 Tax=Chitinophaga silvisoli TaxID=2291814 RepID=A0A3E1P3T4_9BACT|nr:sensor histidine kinase [Chitinophaga silvisoli]RFM34832.1 sensor histidine kinase [Chitinophaga silvisoli]